MRISIQRSATDEPPGSRSVVVWDGTDGQDAEILPGSLCEPILRVGEWRRVDEVLRSLSEHAPDGGELTCVRLSSSHVAETASSDILIPMNQAAHMVLTAALQAADVLNKSSEELWIRVL